VSRSPVIFWFRRDLRLADNPALLEALSRSNGDVAPVFIVDATFAGPAGPTRIAYLRRTLEALDQSLGGRLIVRAGAPAKELTALCRELRARSVVATGDYGPKGTARDALVARQLESQGVRVTYVDSAYVVAPGTVRTKAGAPCRVFSAFRRGWELEPVPIPLASPRGADWLGARSEPLDGLSAAGAKVRPWYFGDLPDASPELLAGAGEGAGREQLDRFERDVDDYARQRDLPGAQGTSRLSAHLRFGSLHPRQVLAALDGTSRGREAYRSQVCWREFYADVMFHNPESVRTVLQPSLEHLRVDRDGRGVARFQSWARGETGFPLVDAGMRQLLDEGWMHNRVRMVCASFLVKQLHLDWRWGARWFMWRLIDGDIASNQHGWQWTAGTGTDAAPFHRVFNPTLQAERFDPNGAYVRRYVRELAEVPAPPCLQPGGGAGLLAPGGYPVPIVDACAERDEALARFAEARELAKVRS
jgi:deoxyribodipyrimidine photo-lyase